MRRETCGVVAMVAILAGLAGARWMSAQQSPTATGQDRSAAAQVVEAGGALHGVVRSGETPLPGVVVTAQNTLTGKRVSTTTDLRGAWTLHLAQNGRYVVRSEFAGFAAGVDEAVLNAASREKTIDFHLTLASRAAAVATRTVLPGQGAQSMSLQNALDAGTETQAAAGGQAAAGAELPQAAANSSFSGESVTISGQQGQVSALAGVDMDRMRDTMETMRAQGGGLFGFGGAGGGPGGGFGGPGMMGGGPGGRGNFRGFNAGQPHGSFFWEGSNSALNAQPFSLRGQSQAQPASGTNRFGISFMSAPYIPGLTKPSGKDTIFLTLSGQRNSTPVDDYAIVPTAAERAGDFSNSGLIIYDPTTGAPFPNNKIPSGVGGRISAQATALLNYFPTQNLTQLVDNYNYHLLSTQQTNQTQFGARYMRTLGKNASLPGTGRGGGSRRKQSQGLRQSINFNYNWNHSATDNVNAFPQLGGKSTSTSNSLQAGYTVGYHKLTSIFSVNWNRSRNEARNFFTNTEDVATDLGIMGAGGTAVLNSSPLNYGLPNVTLSSTTGLSEQQPSFSLSQTVALSETVSWIKGKHNLRFGGDYRRVHKNVLGGSNATGTFTFTGLFTQNAAGDATTGSAIADLLLGLPQSTTINASAAKSYLRDNVLDAYVMDDWRVNRSLTLNYGLRYEYFAPYTEKNGHLAMVATNAASGFTSLSEVQAGVGGQSAGIVSPYRKAVAPRVGLAWRVPGVSQMVLRAGYGMNYMVGQYGSFASTMAHQPMPSDANFVNQQTNTEANASGKASSACALTSSCFTLANGFGAADTVGNYAVDPHYPLPYVHAWNVNVQKSLPMGIVVNAGYNGSKGSNLDIKSAPWASTSSPPTNPTSQVFTYDQAAARSRFHAGTLSVQKRLSSGLALGAFYKYAHSIDNSVSMAQNWQALGAEEANSTTDVRHAVNGNYLYELPFGPDKEWFTMGKVAHVLEGLSISGTFQFATGTPLTPSYQAAVSDVTRGTAGTLRPDRVAGQSVTVGGGSLKKWFNTSAFTTPLGTYGTAARSSIAGPGTITNDMALAKTMRMGATRSWEFRATSTNVFNTVQYAGVDTNVSSKTFGQVNQTSSMRKFQFESRFRF